MKRSEISVIGLYEGIIGRYDFTPISSRQSLARKEYESSIEVEGERVLSKSSFSTSIPLTIQKTFTIPGRIIRLGQTKSARSITQKNLIVMLDAGQVYSFNLKMIHPRRPLTDPSQSGKCSDDVLFMKMCFHFKFIMRVRKRRRTGALFACTPSITFKLNY